MSKKILKNINVSLNHDYSISSRTSVEFNFSLESYKGVLYYNYEEFNYEVYKILNDFEKNINNHNFLVSNKTIHVFDYENRDIINYSIQYSFHTNNNYLILRFDTDFGYLFDIELKSVENKKLIDKDIDILSNILYNTEI